MVDKDYRMKYPRLRTKECYLIVYLLVCCTIFSCRSGPEDQGCNPAAYTPSLLAGEETEVFVPMRDCIKLATDVYLPKGEPPFPAILVRLPYNKKGGVGDFNLMSVVAVLFNSNGYALIIQDTRGRVRSEGAWHPFLYEQEDGLDTVRWIEAQSWFDGNLGTFGGSYFGFTQIAVAHQMPDSLKTIVPMVTPSTIYPALYLNGLPRSDITVHWSLSMRQPDLEAPPSNITFEDAALHWPLIEGDDIAGGDIAWYNEWMENVFDDDYYESYIPHDVIQRIHMPALMITGWFDVFAQTQLEDFVQLKSQPASAGSRIIVGPWTHGMGVTENHDLVFSDQRSLLSFLDQILEWFDVHLKGASFATDWEPVQVYDPGKGVWIGRDSLWPAGQQEKILYLTGDQGALECGSEGKLGDEPPVNANSITYTYDPLNPIKNKGGPILIAQAGCKEQPPHCERQDIVRFQSKPFSGDLAIDGELSLELTVSSTAPDTAFAARLYLVKPDGKSYFLREGVMTLSHRQGNQEQAFYKPGEEVEIRIDMIPLLWTVFAGESLRLEIMSSNFPSIVQHPNVDRDWFSHADPQSAEQTIHLAVDRPSRLILKIHP